MKIEKKNVFLVVALCKFVLARYLENLFIASIGIDRTGQNGAANRVLHCLHTN